MANTTINDVIDSFHSHPLAKQALPEGLEQEFFNSALGQFELDVKELGYDNDTMMFNSTLPKGTIYTLGMLMYVQYLTRELSRIEKLNGFNTKDISMTGVPASKTITKADLELQIARCEALLYKHKPSAYN